MTPHEAQMQAAQALSDLLTEQEVAHAFIGGFAVNVLGHNRATTDVDVEIDVAEAAELRGRISPLLVERDARFSQDNLKLFFTPSNHPELRVPIETLPVGELGLPRRLAVIQLGDSLGKFFRAIHPQPHVVIQRNLTYLETTRTVPILRPGVLVLTKIKRCVQFIGSTRPKSIVKFNRDLSDIRYLLQWLAQHNEKVDFAGYSSPMPDRLYSATKDLRNHWKETGEDEWVELMDSLLEQDDQDKIVAG